MNQLKKFMDQMNKLWKTWYGNVMNKIVNIR